MSRLAEVLRYAEDRRAELLAVVRAADPAALERRPAADEWSPAEVLDHLQRVEQVLARAVAKRLAALAAEGLPPEPANGAIAPGGDRFGVGDRSRRLEAPEFVRPAPGVPAGDALAALDASRLALHAALADAEGYALDAVTLPHPYLGPLNVYQWIEFLGDHDARHAAQIRDALARAGMPH